MLEGVRLDVHSNGNADILGAYASPPAHRDGLHRCCANIHLNRSTVARCDNHAMASGDLPSPEPTAVAQLSALADLIARHRPASRRLRRLVALLTAQPRDLASLVRQTALPRQTVEAALAAIADDLVRDGSAVAIQSAKVPVYRELIGYQDLVRTELADPLSERLADAGAIVEGTGALMAKAPTARLDLDHVPATAETVVRRALWLDSTYDLADTVLLCVGDHDLTSLAVGQVRPGVKVVVVDIDEPTLEYIDARAVDLGFDIWCLAGDLRFGLPGPAIGSADLVFTDPPYTPEGVGLFVTRGLEGLGNRDNGRVIVAYGYSDRHPTLGFQVQSVAYRLGLAYEMMLPAFNRYDGAQAIGSASDLYVWRPTTRTWRSLDRFLPDVGMNIYTRGPRALEQGPAASDVVPATVRKVAAEAGFPIRIVVGDGWRDGEGGAARLRLETLLSGGVPPGMTGRKPFAMVADLSADPGPWLLRVLLAANADRIAAVVRSEHPDVRSEVAQRSLAGLLRPKYELRFLRSQPDNWHTIIVANAVDPEVLDPAGRLAQRLMRRVHGKVGNVWREGLIDAERQRGGDPLTKRDARAAVAEKVHQARVLDAPLIALPRHEIAQVLRDAAASAEPPG
jgi:predicted methyltransferase